MKQQLIQSSTPAEQAATIPAGEILRVYFEERRSLSETARQLGIKRGTVEHCIKQAGHKLRPMGEGVRLAKIGQPRLKLNLRTHPDERPADKWKIVELKIAGKSNREIAKLLNRAQPNIYIALRRMGFPDGTGVTACYSFGERFDRAALRHLHKISGLNVTELARQIKIGFSTLEPHLAPRGGRQIHFNTARRASEWRKNLFVGLMAGATRNPGRQKSNYGQSRVIVTFFPNLRERYSFLLEVLHRLAKKLRDNPEWSRDQLQQYLCEQAMGEKAGRNPGDLFIRFLPWAPELMAFLAGKLQDLQGVRHQRLAWELLAGSLGTTAPIISAVINPAQAQKTRPIPLEQMRSLILDWNRANVTRVQPLEPQQQPKKRGRGLEKGATLMDTGARITIAASFGPEPIPPSTIAHRLYPNQTLKANALHSTVVFLGRHREKIQRENARLDGLSATQRKVEIQAADQRLKTA